MQARIQVFVFGHPLSNNTRKYLGSIAREVKIYKVLLHIERFCDTLSTVEEVFDTLESQGADLSGKTPTYFTAPGSSVAAMALAGAWLGLAGEAPKVLNLIRDPRQSGTWVPSPEMPVLDLQSFRNLQRRRRISKFNGVETMVVEPVSVADKLDITTGV